MRKVTLPFILKSAISIFSFCLTSIVLHSQPQILYQPVITNGLSEPIEVVTAPGDNSGRLFIVQKGGAIRIWDNGSLVPLPFLDISGIIASDGERGLLSMAFHPQYQSNGYFFIYYTTNAGNLQLARYQVSADPNIANPLPDPSTPLINIPKSFPNHNGGHLQFKVESGINYLYFATGDGGGSNDPDNNAQDMNSLLGKMIRMNVDLPTPVPQIWGWGLRNPFRWSFDRANGDMWIGDVGQGLIEEVNYRAGGSFGANYGWACFEGLLDNSAQASGSADCDSVNAVKVLPIFDYDNPPGNDPSSVIGGVVYRGSEFPSLQGYYITADFYSGQLWLIQSDGVGGWNISTQNGLPGTISSFSETDDGSTVYAVNLGAGEIYRIVVPIVAPLTLVNFSGRVGTGYNDLKWTAETESNIEKYIVEFSPNGQTYSPAGEVNSLNNGDRNTYTFRHYLGGSSKVYYRLKIAELNQRLAYSPVIILRSEDRLAIRVYPTVVSGNSISVIAGKPVNRVRVFGADGSLVLSRDLNGADGFFNLPLPGLTKGIYMVNFTGNDFQSTCRIIVQ